MVKKGFTLSETLIAMAIIGVLGMVLIPTIQKSMPNKNKVMFRKSYNTMLSVISNMINDDVNYPGTVNGNDCTTPTAVSVPAGFSNEATTNNIESSNTYNKFCYFFFDQMNVVSGGPTSCPLASAGTALSGAVKGSDGVVWYIYAPAADATTFSTTYASGDSFPRCANLYPTKITFDVNETGKKDDTDCATAALTNPTISACGPGIKPDTFQVNVRYDGKVVIPASDTNANTYLSNPTDNT